MALITLYGILFVIGIDERKQQYQTFEHPAGDTVTPAEKITLTEQMHGGKYMRFNHIVLKIRL